METEDLLKTLEGIMAEEKSAGEKILDALKKAGIKVGKRIIVKETPESRKRWEAINKFCREVKLAHKATKNSKLRFKAAVL